MKAVHHLAIDVELELRDRVVADPHRGGALDFQDFRKISNQPFPVAVALGADPGGVPARILSVLPPFSPLLMPLRIATGSASIVEIALAVVLLAGAVVLLLRLAGRIYAHTLLHRGARLRWREALSTAAED